MEKKKNKTKEDWQGRIPIWIVFGIFCIIAYFVGQCHSDKVEKYGVWTIQTVNKIAVTTNGGSYTFHFTLKGKNYKGSAGGGNNKMITKGKRLFMLVIPDDPTAYLCFFKPVPDWFTAEAPYNGWKTFPTDEELRAIMSADSVRQEQIKDSLERIPEL